MAISLKTAGAWARMVTDNGTVAIPGTPAAGDRMLLFGSWKDYAITVATPSGWTLLDSFADGTTSAGNGTGSVTNAVYYRDWVSGDAAPAIDYSAAPTEGHWVIMLWTKAGGDTWGTPAAVHAAITAVDPWDATASATVDVPDASVVMSLVGLRDDSATIARGASGSIAATASPPTWNGSYVESPATHFTSTTGLDMSGDLGHRFVTTGANGVSLMTAGDPAAAETGTCTWVVQGLFVSSPQSVTPTTASLVLATFAALVVLGTTLTPSTASLATARFAPTVATPTLATPTTAALTLATFAPSVLTPVQVVPGVASLATATFAPTVTVDAGGVSVTPDVASLALATFAPVVSTPVLATPSTASLVLATFAPTVSTPTLAVPGTAALVLATFTPTVIVAAGGTLTPGTASLVLAAFAPTVLVPVQVVPGTASATLATFAPTVSVAAAPGEVVTSEPAESREYLIHRLREIVPYRMWPRQRRRS